MPASNHSPIFVVCFTLIFFWIVPVRAEPNKADPAAPLSAHATMAAAKDLAARGYALVAESEKVLDQAEQAIASGKPERIPAKPLGQVSVKTAQAERIGIQLEDMGEPAGLDIRFRLVRIRVRTLQAVNAYRGTAPGARLVQLLRLQMQRGRAKREQVAKQIEQQAAKNIPQAERTLNSATDSLHASALFDPAAGAMAIFTPFNHARSLIEPAVAKARREETHKHCAEILAGAEAHALGWLAEAAAASQSIQQNGQASVAGNLVSGPHAMRLYGDQWGQAHAHLMQSSALLMIDSGLKQGGHAMDGSAGNSTSVVQAALDIERQLAEQVAIVLAQLISGDVQNATAGDAKLRYAEYLDALAPLQRRASGRYLSEACRGPLQQLAQKANLQSDVDAYQLATGELLRWRKRLADQQLVPMQTQFVTLPNLTRQAFVSRDNYVGLFPKTGTRSGGIPVTATLRASAMDTLAPVLPELVGKSVIATDVLRISPTSRSTIAQCNERTYANIPVAEGLEPYVAALQRDLLVDDTHRPLTLLAASATQAAEWGEYAAVGGQVADVHLEGLVTRLRTLPAVASIFAPRGELPEVAKLPNYLNQIVVRYDVVPTWVRHEYFVATIPK